MTSIFQRALGDDFERLHPRTQARFAISAGREVCQIGRGVMDEVWRGRWFTVPFLHLGATRRLLFPETGTAVPFSVANHAYVDELGRETVTFARRFMFPHRTRAFDATMVFSEERGTVVDYLGDHQHVATDIVLRVDGSGALCLTSGEQRFHEGPVSVRVPGRLTGHAAVREWWDPSLEKHRIEVRVRNPVFGNIFGYRGSFDVEEHACRREDIPVDVLPVRVERRE